MPCKPSRSSTRDVRVTASGPHNPSSPPWNIMSVSVRGLHSAAPGSLFRSADSVARQPRLTCLRFRLISGLERTHTGSIYWFNSWHNEGGRAESNSKLPSPCGTARTRTCGGVPSRPGPAAPGAFGSANGRASRRACGSPRRSEASARSPPEPRSGLDGVIDCWRTRRPPPLTARGGSPYSRRRLVGLGAVGLRFDGCTVSPILRSSVPI